MPQTAPKTPAKLACWIENDLTTIAIIRDLSQAEIETNDCYMPLTGEALERFVLFKILAQNYVEWRSYVHSLLSARPLGGESEEKLTLNRLLLNYLTCAYTIHEHFGVALKQRFRSQPDKSKEYADYLKRLCEKSWDTAFFLDFRGYVQHRGFGVTRYRRHTTPTSVQLVIECDAADLVAESRNADNWSRSRLTASKGRIQLVPTLAAFHVHMVKSYGKFVAKLIYPELQDAAKFYADLTKEALQNRTQFRMIFCETSMAETTEEGTKTTWSLLCPPNDLFGEAGLTPARLV